MSKREMENEMVPSKPTEAHEHANVEPRVSRLEAQLSQLVASFSDFARTSERWRDSLSKDFRQLSDKLSEKTAPQQTDWFKVLGLSGSVIGLLIVIGGLVLWPMQKELTETKNDFHAHRDLMLHPVGKQMIDSIKADLEKSILRGEQATKDLDLKLQKEAMLLVASTEAKANAVQIQLNALRDTSLPTIAERVVVMQEKLKQLTGKP